jgi:hypothetical protein
MILVKRCPNILNYPNRYRYLSNYPSRSGIKLSTGAIVPVTGSLGDPGLWQVISAQSSPAHLQISCPFVWVSEATRPCNKSNFKSCWVDVQGPV